MATNEFSEKMLGLERPDGLSEFELPRRESYHPSPADWRDEVLVLTNRPPQP